MPTFVSAWLDGPTSAAARAHDDVSRDQHSRWRRQRQALLIQMGAKLGDSQDPVGAIQRYVARLTLAHPPAVHAPCKDGPSAPLPTLSGHLVAAARQV